MNIRPPVAVRVAGEAVRVCYARAMNLRSALLSYTRIVQKTDPQVLRLAAEFHQAARDLIGRAVTEKITWQSTKLKE